MTLRDHIALQAIGNEWFETYGSYGVIPTTHPPSLKNPIPVKIPTAQDGFKKGASKAQRRQAAEDLVQIHKQLRRQIGKPEIAHTATYALYPNITNWF